MQVFKGMELELKARVLGPMKAVVANNKTKRGSDPKREGSEDL